MGQNEQELIELMLQIETIMRRRMMSSHHNSRSSFNPHRGQGRIMSLLKLQPVISQKELSFLLDMSKQALAELLSKLEAAGYITRTPSPEDRRVMMIRLTDTGRKFADMIEKQGTDTDSLFSCLSPEEQSTLRDYLKRIIADNEDQLPEGLRRHRRHARSRFTSFDE